MKLGIVSGAFLTTALFAAGCMHGGQRCMGGGEMHGMGGMRERMERPWPTIRIDGPAGALVVMERGVFGEGLHVRAPFQGSFQPTASDPRAGYPLELELDPLLAKHYGAATGAKIYGRLMVSESAHPRGVLVLAPSECALKALIAGDLDELRITAEELPRADVACARAQDMQAAMAQQDAHAGMTHEGAHPGMAHHGDAGPRSCGHAEAAPGGCGHQMGGCAHGACSQGGCMHGGHGGHGHGGASATLLLRVTRFQ